MSTEKKHNVYIWSNNSLYSDLYLSWETSIFKFKKYSKITASNYLIVHIDLETDLTDLTSNLYPLLSAAKESNLKVLVCFSLSSGKQNSLLDKYLEIISTIFEKSINLRILILYDLYTLKTDKYITPFDTFIFNAFNLKSVTMTKNGTLVYYPVSFSQVLSFYEKLLFLNSTSSKIYYLSGIPIKDSDLAYFIKKIYQEYFQAEIDINVVSENKFTPLPYQKIYETQAELNNKVEDKLFEDISHHLDHIKKTQTQVFKATRKTNKIKSIFERFKKQDLEKDNEEVGTKLHSWALKKIEHLFFKVIFIILFAFFVSSVLFVGASYYTLKSLESAAFNLQKGDLVKTSSNYQKAKISNTVVNTNLQIIFPMLNLTSKALSEKSLSVANFLDFTLSTFDGVVQSYILSEKIYNSLNSPQNLDYNTTFLAIKSNVQQVYESLSQMEIMLEDLDLPAPILQAIKQNTEYENLKETKEKLWEMIKLADIIPSVLGADKNTNIFILVQNQNELRGTGGVIEYIYHLSMDKGRVVFLKALVPQEIETLSDLTINAPPLVEKLTGEETWRLKDMNYNPDFGQTATNISWFLENKLKTKADYVVGVNIKFLESFLGSKELNKHMGTDTTYEQFISATQKGEGSVQIKKVMDQIIDNSLNHKFPLVDLFQLVAENKKNYNIWASDQLIQSQIFNQPIAKSINQKDCLPAISTSRKCISETIHLNLSNFSSIPLNGYLERELRIVGTPQVLTIDHEIILTSKYLKQTPLINRNLTEIVQLYLPKSAVLNSIQLDDTSLDLRDVITQAEKDLNRYQFVISTSLNKNYDLSIKYSDQLQERTILPIAYSYNIIPQNGIEYKKQTLEFNLPESSRVSAITSKIDSYPNKIVVDLGSKDSFGYNLVSR